MPRRRSPLQAVLLLTLPIAASPLLDRPPPTSASGLFPPPRVMTPAQRLAQVHERSGVCNGTVVVASCWGFDPEDSTEFLQAALDSGARKVIVPPMCDDSYADCPVTQSTGDHRWVTLPLFLRSNQVVVFQTGVQLWAKRWEYVATGDSVLNLEEVANVDIVGYVRYPTPPLSPRAICRCVGSAARPVRQGAIVQMWKQDYANHSLNSTCKKGAGVPCTYSKAEWRHCINMREAENVTISGLTVSSSGGDGIEVGGEEMEYPTAACKAKHKHDHPEDCRVSVSRNVVIRDL